MVTPHSRSKEIFTDLDALQVEDSWFKYMGRSWRIRPITTLNFFRFSNGVANIQELLKKSEAQITIEQVDKAYVDLFTSCIDEMTAEDVLKMNMLQRAALMNLVVDHVQGRVQGQASGKKNYPVAMNEESKAYNYQLRD